MSAQAFHAVVVGASLAGCTTATLLARQGAKVALIERHADPDSYKRLCTHFIQASALGVIQRLGLDRLIEEAGGLHNPIEIYTPSGWVGSHLGGDPGGSPDHGYNVRRLRLDPLVRQLASRTPGVTVMTGLSAKGLVERDGRIAGVQVAGAGVSQHTLEAGLVVAADGRNSPLAGMAGVEPSRSPNHRFGVFASMRQVDLVRGRRSQMWLTGAEVAYVFPNDDGVTVIAWIGPKEVVEEHRDRPLDFLKERLRALPDAPRLQQAEIAGDVATVKDYPNLWRPPVVRGMALVGDAMLSMDYLWGVGCGWAFQTGAWLADEVAGDLTAGKDLSAALIRYKKRCSTLSGHRFLINDFSKRRSLNPIERLMFAAAAKDVSLARHVSRFGARLDGPLQFLAPAAILKALWINLRQSRAVPQGTRSHSSDASSTAA